MNSILGFAQLMDRSPDRNAEDRRHLRRILDSGEQMRSLINNMLSLSKIEAGQEPNRTDSTRSAGKLVGNVENDHTDLARELRAMLDAYQLDELEALIRSAQSHRELAP